MGIWISFQRFDKDFSSRSHRSVSIEHFNIYADTIISYSNVVSF